MITGRWMKESKNFWHVHASGRDQTGRWTVSDNEQKRTGPYSRQHTSKTQLYVCLCLKHNQPSKRHNTGSQSTRQLNAMSHRSTGSSRHRARSLRRRGRRRSRRRRGRQRNLNQGRSRRRARGRAPATRGAGGGNQTRGALAAAGGWGWGEGRRGQGGGMHDFHGGGGSSSSRGAVVVGVGLHGGHGQGGDQRDEESLGEVHLWVFCLFFCC